MSCVNTKSKEFTDTCDRLGLSAATLEPIVHEYTNNPATEGQFPSDQHVLNKLGIGTSYTERSSAVRKVWAARYATPMKFKNIEGYQSAIQEAQKIFPQEAVHGYINSLGEYVLRVSQPISEGRFELGKGPTLLRKNSWRERRHKEEQRRLPQELRDKVDIALAKYMDKGFGGEAQAGVAEAYFDGTEKYASDIVDAIISNSTDTETVELAKAVQKALGRSKGAQINYNPKTSGTPRGRANTDGTITIYGAATKGVDYATAKASMERTMLHEIVHTITVDAIEANPTLKDEIADIMSELENYTKSNDLTHSYALKNEREFVAEFMSQPRFREALMNLKSKEKLSFGQRVLNIIKKALGLKPKGTLYEKADKVIKKLLDNQARDHYDSLSEERAALTTSSTKAERQKLLDSIITEQPRISQD